MTARKTGQAAAVAALAALALAAPAGAATFNVGTELDSAAVGATGDGVCSSFVGSCTLRAAVQESNDTPGVDEIVLPGREFVLTLGGQLQIAQSVTIRGAGARQTVIREEDATGVLVVNAGDVTLEDLTLTGGRASNAAGGVYMSAGALTLRRVAVVGNQATGSNANSFGGGISAFAGVVTLIDTVVASNLVAPNENRQAVGGGIWTNDGVSLSATNVTIHDNEARGSGLSGTSFGGGLLTHSATLTNVTVTGNRAVQGTGGNLYVSSGSGSAAVANSIFANGSASTGASSNCYVPAGSALVPTGANLQFGAGDCGFTAADPQLSSFGNHGGFTDTLAAPLGSPAIDAAQGCPPPANDQRGNPRPLGAACDIGATELGADLQVVMSADTSGPLAPGGRATFTTVVTNAGADAVPATTLTDQLPPGTALVTALSSNGLCTGSGPVVCDLGPLAAGASASAQVVVDSAKSPELRNTATASAPLPDPNLANNSAALAIPVSGVTVSRVSMLRRRFRVGKKATPVSAQRRRAPKRGTAFRYTLSQPASVRIQIQRQRPGRRAGRRCVKPNRGNRGRRSCKRFVRAGTLRRNSAAGRTSVPFSGRIGRRRLKAGRYRATIVASTGGADSTPRRVGFTVVAG